MSNTKVSDFHLYPIDPGAKLNQGTIFNLKNVRFKIAERDWARFDSQMTEETKKRVKAEGFSFQDFYPFTEFNHEQDIYGIIVTQTCDIYKGDEEVATVKKVVKSMVDGTEKIEELSIEVKNQSRSPKVPFINIGILEPLERVFYDSQENFDDLKKNLLEIEVSSEKIKLANIKDIIKGKSRDYLDIIQNNHKYIFFVAIEEAGELKLKGVNLTKIFPLRVEHYPAISEQACFQLKPDFANAIGWKVAELYGRVGMPVYEGKQLHELVEKFSKGVCNLFEGFHFIENDKFAKLKEAITKQDMNSVASQLANLNILKK